MDSKDEDRNDEAACGSAAASGAGASASASASAGGAASGAFSTASMPAPTNAGLPCRPEGVAGLPAFDAISQRGGATIGGGGGRGRASRGGFRSNYRGAYSQGRGGYDNSASSSYSFSQPRQPYSNRQTGWDSDVQQPLASQQAHRGGRGRGSGFQYGQQNVVRRPYRGSGRFRGSWSRPRRFDHDQLQQDAGQDMAALTEGAEQSASFTGQGGDVATTPGDLSGASVPEQDDSSTTIPLPDESIASIESIALPTPVLEPPSPNPTEAPLNQPLPLAVDTAAEPPIETITAPSNPTSPTRPIHWHDLPFHSLTSLVHPSHAPEMVYAWYPYAVLPGEGARLSPPLPSPLPLTSAAPPPPPLHTQPLPPHPPPHFYFTHDHAFLALCHPVPMVPVPWFPIPYLRYWGPERMGAHPNFYDVPMFASDA
ncbi:conserved hypothetical protein [Sporisorium reilianum SRZ2]|uniref:Uncharacterized protein n=1 Tax=Sporisorium reilianum (strain SRZ2) TaxID=999809 RepID=E6ZLI5_SPORE|nr:conserved hypothetical protein [Sporisorium reilianum SRZ2]